MREASDIEKLRLFLKERNSPARIVAKIEDQSAIDNLDDIIRATDVLMVARGDLGIEVPLEELPVIQRRAVRTCLAIGRPVIIATHMLESMITQPMPNRAEITDVANAVYEQADCVMLSGRRPSGNIRSSACGFSTPSRAGLRRSRQRIFRSPPCLSGSA